MEAFVPPKHETFTFVSLNTIAVGCVNVSVFTDVQPSASVTVTVTVPTASPLALGPVFPFDQL